MPARTAISGAACKVFLSTTGKEVGWATGVDVTENIQNQRVDVIGNIDSEEIAPVRRVATMNVAAIRIQKAPLEVEGLWSTGGTTEILNSTTLDFAVIDENSGDTLFSCEGCKPTSRAFRVDSQSLFTENLSFDVKKIRYPSE